MILIKDFESLLLSQKMFLFDPNEVQFIVTIAPKYDAFILYKEFQHNLKVGF